MPLLATAKHKVPEFLALLRNKHLRPFFSPLGRYTLQLRKVPEGGALLSFSRSAIYDTLSSVGRPALSFL